MGLSFVIGGSGAGKSYGTYKRIIEQSIKEPGKKYFVIVPDQFTMQTQKELVSLHPNKGIMNIDVLSFSRLAHRIFDDSTLNRTVLDDTGKSLILRLVAARCEEKLSVIGKSIRKQGYISEVKSSISEFLQYGVRVDALKEMIEKCKERKALALKLGDIEVLYREFMNYIESKYITTEETLDVLAAMIPKSELLRGSVIVLDGFTGFTPVQYRVLEQLLLCADQVMVTLLLGREENPYEIGEKSSLFYLSKKTIADLRKIAFDNGIPCEEDVKIDDFPVVRQAANPQMAYLEKVLFRYNRKPYDGTEEKIHIRIAKDPAAEVDYVARKIREMVLRGGYCYRDIAVMTGDLNVYAYNIEEVFHNKEIPYYIDQTRKIVLNPFTEYIKSGLKIVINDFSYDSVFHFLRSGFADFTQEEIDRLENYVIALNLRGRKRYEEIFVHHTKETDKDADKLAMINATRARLIECLIPLLQNCGTTGEFVKALYSFMKSAKMEQKLDSYAKKFAEAGDFLKEKEYAQIYRLVIALLEQIYALLSEEKITIEEFADIMDAGLNEIKVGTIPQNVDRVVIGDMERTRLKDIKVLFFIGVNDGIIPKGTGKGGMISDIDREFLSEAGYELAPSPRQKAYIERLYLYMNVTKPTEELWISYAAFDNEGKEKRPSYFIDTIKYIFPAIRKQPVSEGTLHDITLLREGEKILGESMQKLSLEADVTEESAKEFITLYRILEQHGGEKECKVLGNMLEQAFKEKGKEHLSKAVAKILYGQMLTNSVSRLEKYAACAYSHFLKYGLLLQEREEYSFETRDLGNLYHAVLDMFSKQLEKSPYSWFDFPKEWSVTVIEEAVSSCAGEYGNSILYASERNMYVINRMKRILARTVEALQHQLTHGKFNPQEFELSFSSLSDLSAVSVQLSEKEKMLLRGRIDRVDVNETEDKVYVKVIDYKSNDKEFDLVSVYYGLSLQLVVYMNAAMEYEKKKHPDKTVVPAALLYYKVSDPYVQREKEDTPEAIDARIREQLAMTGIVNDKDDVIRMLDNDINGKSTVIPVSYNKNGALGSNSFVMTTEQFELVSQYVNKKIKQIGQEILDGNITLNPYSMKKTDSCTYCSYKDVCGFDVRDSSLKKRTPEVLETDECLNRMRTYIENGD